MAKNIYALLVGIDEYAPASISILPKLKGCVNDIQAIEAYLRERITQDGEWQLIEPTTQSWILTNQAATRQAIINGFLEHLCKADSDDVVLFYYAGHGSQERTPEEFWHLEPDRLNETLVCYDSRTETGRDLADKELNYLISKISQNNPHTLIILDCCYSTAKTKYLSPEIMVRSCPIDWRERPLDSFVFAQDKIWLDDLLTNTSNLGKKITGLILPTGRNILFSACKDYETAQEHKSENGQIRGVFSEFLLKILSRNNRSINYQDLAREILVLVNSKFRYQSPQIKANFSGYLTQSFLGDAISERPFYLNLSQNQQNGTWSIDSGSLHGIPPITAAGDILLALFPLDSTQEDLQQLSIALGEARIIEVLPQKSLVEIISGSESLLENQSYLAVLTNLPSPPLKIYIQGEATGVRQVELDKSSLYLNQVDIVSDADYHLLAHQGQYWITQAIAHHPVVDPIPEIPGEYTSENASLLIKRLENICRWHNILQLSSPATSSIKSDDVEMEIMIISSDQLLSIPRESSEVRVEYTYENEQWKFPIIQVKLTNHSHQTLYCNILELPESYVVDLPFFPDQKSIRLAAKGAEDSNTVISFTNGFIVPDIYWKQGRTEYKDIFKLIVSTTEFDARILIQDGLNQPNLSCSIEEKTGTLDRLMIAINNRELVRARGNYDDWFTKQISITIVRPQNTQSLQSYDSTQLQNGLVEIEPHPRLQAKASLTTIPQVSSDLGNLTLPPILLSQLGLIESFQFTTRIAGDPGLSVLELIDVEDYTVVTPEAPLNLLINTSLANHEYLLPYGFDGEFFIPLGKGKNIDNGKSQIILERLSPPLINHRTVLGSIRIFLAKISKSQVKQPSIYPILSVADIKANQTVSYETNPELIQTHITKARRIILLIHGFADDTNHMVSSINKILVELNGQKQSINELYDLVLTFDYDYLQTNLVENAKFLQQKLQAVGLGANHGKELHIVAHTLGGLVSRWLIEREGGNQVVQHLIMLGTVNSDAAGYNLSDWVITNLGIGLNQLSTMIWPTHTFAHLLEFLEVKEYSLELAQLDEQTAEEFVTNPDPHVPYTIILGNKSLIPAVTAIQPGWESSPIQRLIQSLLVETVDLAFFPPSSSLSSISPERTPQPRILADIPCDRFTYFTHPVWVSRASKGHPTFHLSSAYSQPRSSAFPLGYRFNC